MHPSTPLLALALAALTFAPVPSAVASDAPPATQPASSEDPAMPLVVPEAARPEGWPKLTPVDQIEVKELPAYRMARVPMTPQREVGGDEPAEDGSDNGAFMTLFNHIKKNDIAMTAPVEMEIAPGLDGAGKGEDAAMDSMAFLYRTPDLGEPGADGDIEVTDVPASTVVSIGVRGRSTPQRVAEAVAKLDAWLEANAAEWRAVDGEPARYLGYNSPMVPPAMRYGEVQRRVERVAAPADAQP